MNDLETRMAAQATASVYRATGSMKLTLPIEVGREDVQHVEIGINLVAAPAGWFKDNPIAAFKLRAAIDRALTSDVSVKYGVNNRPPEDVLFKDVLADLILQKARSAL